MAVLPAVLPGITGLVAQVGNVAPPLLLLAQLAAGSVLGAAAAERQHVQDCADVRVIFDVGDLRATEDRPGEVVTGPTPEA